MNLTIQHQDEITFGEKFYPAGNFLHFSELDFTIGETEENLKNEKIIKIQKTSYGIALCYYGLRATISQELANKLIGLGVTQIS